MGNDAQCHLDTNAADTSKTSPVNNHPAAAWETEACGDISQGQMEVTLAGGRSGAWEPQLAAQHRSDQAHAPFAGQQQHPPGSAWGGSWTLELCSEHCSLPPTVTSAILPAAPGEQG